MQEPCHRNARHILPSRLITTSYDTQSLPELRLYCQNGSPGGTWKRPLHPPPLCGPLFAILVTGCYTVPDFMAARHRTRDKS